MNRTRGVEVVEKSEQRSCVRFFSRHDITCKQPAHLHMDAGSVIGSDRCMLLYVVAMGTAVATVDAFYSEFMFMIIAFNCSLAENSFFCRFSCAWYIY